MASLRQGQRLPNISFCILPQVHCHSISNPAHLRGVGKAQKSGTAAAGWDYCANINNPRNTNFCNGWFEWYFVKFLQKHPKMAKKRFSAIFPAKFIFVELFLVD